MATHKDEVIDKAVSDYDKGVYKPECEETTGRFLTDLLLLPFKVVDNLTGGEATFSSCAYDSDDKETYDTVHQLLREDNTDDLRDRIRSRR